MSTLPVVLGLLVLLTSLVFAARASIARTYPEAMVLGSVGFLTAVQISSDALSLVGAFRPVWISVFWMVVLLPLIAFMWSRRSRLHLQGSKVDGQSWFAYAGTGLLSFLTLLTGFLVAPNNWDSLTYHLSRGAHWLQQGSLDFFVPTSSRENTMSPLGDLVFAHLQVTGGDAGATFLGQWVAGIVVLVGVGILAQEIFDNPRVTALSVLSAATVPMLLSQMSTTQADLIAGVPLAAGVIAWRWLRQGRAWGPAVLITLLVGLAAAIKTTSVLLILPWVAMVVVELARKRAWRPLGTLVGLGLVWGLALNGWHVWRLLTQRSGPLDTATDVFNQVFTPEAVLVNVLRDVTTGVLVPVPAVVGALQAASENTLVFLGLDPALPGATFGSSYTLSMAWSEDHAAAPWHVLLIFVALAWLAIRHRTIPGRRVALLVALLATQVLLIAVVIRWQPWINRFTFLIIVFAAPLVGWLLTRWPPHLSSIAATVLVIAGVAWVLFQPLRGIAGTSWLPANIPLAGSVPRYESPLTYDRFSQMFMHHPPSAEAYRQALIYAHSLQPDTLKVALGGDWWEFPIWAWSNDHSDLVELTHDRGIESNRVVRICTEPCADANLTSVRTFAADGPSSPSVETGPTLVIGVEN